MLGFLAWKGSMQVMSIHRKVPKKLLRCGCFVGLFLAILSSVTAQLRVATFNTSLFRDGEGDLMREMENPQSGDPKKVAEIIQIVRPDILLLNEFDFDVGGVALDDFHDNFLSVGQGAQAAIDFPFRYVAESNTGIAACFDLNNDGRMVKTPETVGYGEDSFGFGQFPGQFGMAVLSRYPIQLDRVRTFQKFLWNDMPGALLPDIQVTPAEQDWYNAAELEVFRLSSKSHWDLPIDVDGQIVHLLAAHPTPPTFDGAENRNGLRNHDEIRLWADYVRPGAAGYLYDDEGGAGGIGEDVRFVICGDYNADPASGQSVNRAILQLLENPAVDSSLVPEGASGTTNTSTFGLRVDYVLPSVAGLEVLDGAIFWPTSGQPGSELVGVSDHRLVWMDLEVLPLISEVVRDLKIEVAGSDVAINWAAEAGVVYGVEVSADLVSWAEIGGSTVEVADGVATLTDTAAAVVPGRKFYRITATFE